MEAEALVENYNVEMNTSVCRSPLNNCEVPNDTVFSSFIVIPNFWVKHFCDNFVFRHPVYVFTRYMVRGREFTLFFIHFVGMWVLMVRNLGEVELKPSVTLPLLLPETVCRWHRTR